MKKSLLLYFCVLSVLFFSKTALSQITSKTFSYTGSVQTFIVPCGVDSLRIKAWGGGGSGGGADSYIGAPGGGGGYVETDLFVTPGQLITVIVGGGGGAGGNCASSAPGGTAGWGNGTFDGGRGGNAGASGCSGGGGAGGGASAIINGSTIVLVAAGGGGGSGGGLNSAGGAGGAGGQNGNSGSGCATGVAGGNSTEQGVHGGDRGGADGAGGGGGGGGYNGGTGGGAPPGCDCGGCGGGGGNSYSSGINTIITNGSGQTAGNGSDPQLPSGVAEGGYHSAGGDGYIVIQYVDGSPEAGFSNTTVCNGKTTSFSDNSATLVGVLTNYSWDFGDSSPLETTQNPTHTYTASGTYTATLIVTNTPNCRDTATHTVTVYSTPVASFTTNDVCLGDSVPFSNSSTIDANGTIAGYGWQLGDGGTSTFQNPAHKYLTGTDSVVLIAYTSNMCADTASQVVHTFDPPTSSFITNDVCLINEASFSNTSLPPTMGTIAGWSWDFGDGSSINTSTLSPQHLYDTAGNYNITLINTSSNLGCADTQVLAITIFPMPVANFGWTDVCLNTAMIFGDSSTVSSGTITAWAWDFGDASGSSSVQSPTYTYDYPSLFDVTLVATTNNGCADTITNSVAVHPNPVAEFSSVNVCDGFFAYFTNESSVSGTDIIIQDGWSYGDNTFDTNQNPSHLYSTAGTYNVQLLVITDFGCVDSVSHPFVVNPNPVVNFTAAITQGCEPLCITLQDSSSISNGGQNVSWTWDLGDGSPGQNLQNAQHCYEDADVLLPVTFTPSLTVVSDSGCISAATKDDFITVFPAPIATFSATPANTTIIDPVITIIDASIGANSWDWNFGDMTTFSGATPQTHEYADTGTYQIVLITTTSFSCSDTAYQTVVIEPDFVLYVPNAFSPNGDGINDVFTAQGSFITDFKMDIFDRWGNHIFTSDSIDKPWDGKANKGSQMAQLDVYVYSIVAKDLKDKTHTFRGTVTILK